jgi:hypothetical protein
VIIYLQFLTFAERLTGINIDVVRRIGKRAEVPEVSCQFHQSFFELLIAEER